MEGAVSSWLVHATLVLVAWVGALAGALCCVLGQDFIFTVPLYTQEYNWVKATLMLPG